MKRSKKCKTSHFAQFNRLDFFFCFYWSTAAAMLPLSESIWIVLIEPAAWMNEHKIWNDIELNLICRTRIDLRREIGSRRCSRFWVCSSHTCCAILLKDQIKINKIWSTSSDRFLLFFFCNTAQCIHSSNRLMRELWFTRSARKVKLSSCTHRPQCPLMPKLRFESLLCRNENSTLSAKNANRMSTLIYFYCYSL